MSSDHSRSHGASHRRPLRPAGARPDVSQLAIISRPDCRSNDRVQRVSLGAPFLVLQERVGHSTANLTLNGSPRVAKDAR